MQKLTSADWRIQPWANGRGQTAELWRLDRAGALQARLSMAQVAEDGPFSALPGIARNLTVLTGPGFRLSGPGVDLDCRPLVPVVFDGGVPVVATGTAAGPSEDFNVMTADSLPRPEVRVVQDADLAAGGLLALFALEPARVAGQAVDARDLVLTRAAARIEGRVLAVRLWLGD